MSQAKQFEAGETDPLARPVEGKADLIQFFIDAARPRNEFLIGVEHERFAVMKGTIRPVPFYGPRGIEALLKTFALISGDSWQLIEENHHVIALSNGKASVTLEPGGQVELSGAPQKNLTNIDAELTLYESHMKLAAAQLGIEFLQVGYHSSAQREDFEWVPKERYGIMRRYMPKVGSRGIDMMLRTCTVQVNLDYENEADMVESVRCGFALSPLVTAIFRTGDGERTRVWHDTDPSRCGFPQFIFESGFGFERWVDYVLDVPMYFIRRDGHYVDVAGASFRDFMRMGLKGHKAQLRDFADHLSTIFTEVRVKPQIELRSADCGSASSLRALPKFWVNILYHPSKRQQAFEMMEDPSARELSELQLEAARVGLDATYRGRSLRDMVGNLEQLGLHGSL